MDIAVTALIAALLLAVEHFIPWFDIFHRPLPRLGAYILGVAAMIVPLTALFILWRAWLAILALWSVVLAGGLAVMLCYAFDAWRLARADLRAEDEIRRAMKGDQGHAQDV